MLKYVSWKTLSFRKKDKQRWQYAMLHFHIFLTICTNLTQFLYIIDSNNNVTYEIWEYFSFNNLCFLFAILGLKKKRVWTKYHKQLQIMGDYLYVLNPLLSKTHNSKYWQMSYDAKLTASIALKVNRNVY